MTITHTTCREFTERLAAKEAVPGGGGAAALVGSIGVALNSMVANFSIGKKKFLTVEETHRDILKRGEQLRVELLDLIEQDAENFLPLSKAYGIKADTDEEKAEKDRVLQNALKIACSAPVQMVECIYDSILLHEELVEISSKLIISDIGVGVQCLKAALFSAQLNVMINLNSIKDEDYVNKIKSSTEAMVSKGSKTADDIYAKVLEIMN